MEFNETKASEIGLKVKERPSIPAPEENIEFITVPGRDGSLTIRDGTVKDIVINITFTFYTKPELFAEIFRKAKKWLLGKGKKRLEFSDDTDFFYQVRNVTIGTSERTARVIGEFTAEFSCCGCQYLIDGVREHKLEEVRYNPHFIAHPIYKIKGEGKCTLNVNGNVLKANIGQNLTVDTELMIAYREDGTLANTEVSGDYENLYLLEGENKIDITDGFELKVIPNWRCL